MVGNRSKGKRVKMTVRPAMMPTTILKGYEPMTRFVLAALLSAGLVATAQAATVLTVTALDASGAEIVTDYAIEDLAALPQVELWTDNDYIDAVYEEHFERHRLSEVYVIERDFDGTRQPFMTFEHGNEHHDEEELHSLENEESEYRTQIEQIRRFAEDPSLEALLSQPVELCVEKTGVVLSVPIRSKGELVGIVAGMIPSENISELLERDNYANMVVIGNSRPGEMVPGLHV